MGIMPERIVGVDLGDRYSHYCSVDGPSGDILEEGRVPTTRHGFLRCFGRCGSARVVVEVGTHSPWLSRLLEECGHEVLVANARRLRFIYAAENKRDRLDARSLARVGRLDPQLLSPIRHRGPRAQRDLALLRARDALVSTRTKLINHVRGALKATGRRAPGCSSVTFHRRSLEAIPPDLEHALQPVVDTIATLTARIRGYDERVEGMCENEYPVTRRLRQVPGVGPLTALGFVLTLEDPRRFHRSRRVGAYLGLRPRLDQSGESNPQRRITKTGDPFLRRLLVGAAHYILGPFGPDSDLRTWGLALAARGGARGKKRAVVAVARRLAILLHRLWITGMAYEPCHHSVPDTATSSKAG